MENASELLREPSSGIISLTMRHRLNPKRNVERSEFSFVTHSITKFLPAERQFLRHSQTALTWNLVSLYFRCIESSRPTARKAVGSAGRGNLKKQMPFCNGTDRGKVKSVVTAFKVDASTRKGADFRYWSGSVMQTSNLL